MQSNRLKHHLLITILALCSLSAHAVNPPNVVLIFADDLGYGDLGCYGATKVRTPNIDRLAEQGRRFTDAHTASAVCTASRYALLTGDYPIRQGTVGVWGPHSHRADALISPDQQTLGKVFQEAGYATACFGKWHLGFGVGPNDWNKPLKPGPLEFGFDYYYGIPQVNSGPPFVYVENHSIVGYDPNDPLRSDKKNASPTPTFPEAAGRKSPNPFAGAVKAHELYDDEQIATTLLAKSTEWIGKNKQKPFFLYLATTNIHHPFTPAPRFKGTSDCGLYGDFIHELDWVVGEVRKCLEKNGVADNTLIIFTSDNGGMFNTTGQDAWDMGHRINGELLGFKFGAWEGGHRVPFIAHWPGKIKASSVSDQLICNVDLTATMAALTGVEVKEGHARDSVNVLSTLTGDPKKMVRENLVLAPRQSQCLSLRKGKWMYISGKGSGGFGGSKRGDHAFGGAPAITYAGYQNSDVADGRIRSDAPPAQLYDLEADLTQTKNVYREFPEVVKELEAELSGYRRRSDTQGSPAKSPGKATKTRNQSKPVPYDNAEPVGNLRFDFETGDLQGWKVVEGSFDLIVSDRSSLPGWVDKPFNKQGKYHLSTVESKDGSKKGDPMTGVIESPRFVLEGKTMSFLVGGGAHDDTYVALCADGGEVLRAGGSNGPIMLRVTWDVRAYQGKEVFLRVVDRRKKSWAHITFDDFSAEGRLR